MEFENDLYFILGVNVSANKTEITKAFKKLCLKHHPDKGGDRIIFLRLKTAYNYLINDMLREIYNNEGYEAMLALDELM